jgi:hypothetical protein
MWDTWRFSGTGAYRSQALPGWLVLKANPLFGLF